jgi:DNA polymerase
VAWAAEADDDLLGEPLSGPGGLRLRRALQEAGIDPASLLLTLVVRCAGKTVRAGHRDACRPWLDAELEAARPAAVVALGVEVARLLTGDRTLVLADHLGQALVVPDAPYRIIPWYAPAGILSGGGRYRSTVELFQRLVQEYA